MTAETDAMQIQSFRICFRLERRIHKVDRWRVPLPYGMPVHGLLYGVGILAALLLASRVPLLSSLLDAIHPIIRYGALPIAGGYALTELKLDDRAGHQVARSWLRMHVEPKRLAAFRRAPVESSVRFAPVTVTADCSGPELRRAVIEGEGRVVVRGAARMDARGRTLRVRPEAGPALARGRQVALRSGQRIVIG